MRVITATNRHLFEEVQAGRFREDLYYRLAGMTIDLLPLRERRMDIPTLANWLLQQHSHRMGKTVEGFGIDALQALQAYDWPGNVRELHNEVQRMLVMAQGRLLDAATLSPHISGVMQHNGFHPKQDSFAPPLHNLAGTLKDQVELLETHIIRAAISRHHGNKSRAAEELGLSRVGLRNKLDRYGIAE